MSSSSSFPLPEEFTDFVSKYFAFLWKIAESVEQNKPDECIQRIRNLNKVNAVLDTIFDSVDTDSSGGVTEEVAVPVDFDPSTLSLAMYLKWCKDSQTKRR